MLLTTQNEIKISEILPSSVSRRLSSTGEGSGDSSTTASGSSYGEREDGSEGRAESDETEREERKPLEGQITDSERQQVETFFKGLKTQVKCTFCTFYLIHIFNGLVFLK